MYPDMLAQDFARFVRLAASGKPEPLQQITLPRGARVPPTGNWASSSEHNSVGIWRRASRTPRRSCRFEGPGYHGTTRGRAHRALGFAGHVGEDEVATVVSRLGFTPISGEDTIRRSASGCSGTGSWAGFTRMRTGRFRPPSGLR